MRMKSKSRITIEAVRGGQEVSGAMFKAKKTKKLRLLHPGEYLRSVLDDAGLSANAVALALRVPANRLTEILNGRRAITADTAMRLGRYFGTSAQMWINLQAKYDLEAAEETLAERIEMEVQPMRRAS
jgi:antitoxin HigA-1